MSHTTSVAGAAARPLHAELQDDLRRQQGTRRGYRETGTALARPMNRASRPVMMASASVTILVISSATVGTSFISPCDMPAYRSRPRDRQARRRCQQRRPASGRGCPANWPPPPRISTTSRLTELQATRAGVAAVVRKISSVAELVPAATICLLDPHRASSTRPSPMKRVPMLTPSAPSASAADQPAAVGESAGGDRSGSSVPVGRRRDQHQPRHVILAGVPGALEAVDRRSRRPRARCADSLADRASPYGSP